MDTEDKFDCIKPKFTARQLEIMSYWAETPSAQSVADRMKLSKHTINVQLGRMRSKINAKKTVEVLLFIQYQENCG